MKAIESNQRPIRGADLFCGSGGFSTGLVRACEQLFPGRPLDLVAVNHWQVAIDTHQRNHPGIRHYCADLEHLKPRDAVPGGVLDILLAAPACTYHSRARGGKPVYDQQRMDPWHVVRWCTDLRVHRLLVENVPEFVDWGPCDVRTGKPIKSRKGEYFRAWLAALKGVGMRGHWKIIKCSDFGDATTRERFFYYGRTDKQALKFPEPTHARGGSSDLFGTRQPWRSAAEIIDWSRPGTSIFTRKRPLVKNTVSRLLAGAKRNNWPQQHIDALEALVEGRAPRLLVSAEEAEAIARQLGISLVMAAGAGGTARGVDKPIPSVTTGAAPHFAEPILLHKHLSDGGRTYRSVQEPMPTATTEGAPTLARPIITPYYGNGSGRTGQSVDEPLPAQGTKERFAVATPFLVPSFGERAGQAPRTHDITEPAPAITASGHIQLAEAFVFRANQGDGRNGSQRAVSEPLPTATCSESMALAQPFISLCTHGNESNPGRAIDEPLPTVTTAKGGEMTLATPIVDGYYIDILYRMLHWSELARATSFEDQGRSYHFTGTATEITKQIGNAVPIRTGTALCAAALEGMRQAA